MEYAHRAAIGLERHDHTSGVVMAVELDGENNLASLHWTTCPPADAVQLDRHRVTEDAAEAIALALVHEAKGWVVLRRLQRGESADWELVDAASLSVALEVSGMDKGDNQRRIRDKSVQASRATAAATKAACVVELATPRATLAPA